MLLNKRYSSALQEATNQFKSDALNYTAVNGGKVPDDTLYTAGDYYFKVKDNALVQITKDEYRDLNTDIRNIIFLIPDGAGFGTYDIANALKTATGGGVKGQATPITHDAITGKTVSGLYLDEYMIAAADTYQYYGETDGATDSTAAGTALLGGYKTNYLMCGVNNTADVRANLLEVCRLNGKSTGVVTTKCLIDATPCAASVHLLRRPDQKASYQEDANKQYMVAGLDVLLAYGTDGGYYRDGSLITTPLKARDYGYSIVTDKASLYSTVDGGATKVFSNILSDCNGEYGSSTGTDYQANHIKYDVNANGTTDLTLMDLAKNALKVLSENIDNENGFCLMIEGGAIDNACEGRKVKEGVGDYLAFDEVFAYCVNWAMNDGHTIVVACPDHDSGGFYNQDNDTSSAPKQGGTDYSSVAELITALSNGTVANNTTLDGYSSSHTGQNVPVWLYAPAKVRSNILTALGLPQDASAAKVRTGKYYDGTVINSAYRINNSDISPAIASVLGLGSFDAATEALFYQVNKDTTTFGTYDPATEIFTFKNGETVKRNSNYWTEADGITKHYFDCGYSLYLTNDGDTYGGTGDSTSKKLHVNPAAEPGTYPNRFYVPKSALAAMGYLS